VKTVIIPADNEVDLENIDQTVRAKLSFVTAENVDDILDVALVRRVNETAVSAPIPVQGQERIPVRQ
jgi:ATP-dependent Lon protease